MQDLTSCTLRRYTAGTEVPACTLERAPQGRPGRPPLAGSPMPHSFRAKDDLRTFVGRTPWSAAGALVGFFLRTTLILWQRRVLEDPRGPGGPPHNLCRTARPTKKYA